ncbi:MAG: class I mannose-6-phosphate isomerase [Planctomycetes bacterium]|nr:class I mannose-6-phosphate isomerase [Planctomycetota bacterium]
MTPPATLGPLRFERIVLEKIWGGRELERVLGLELPGSGAVGETWEISDRADHNSLVASGPERGTSLADLVRLHGEELLGGSRLSADGSFPLLVKFLDASQPLSLQVHPHERTRVANEEKKSECWYILDARPDARIWLGLVPGATREKLAAAPGAEALNEFVLEWPVHAGDFVHVPAGTVHAIGGGITLVEIQENADITHRLHDWGRTGTDGKPRPLQVADALRAARYDAPVPAGPRPASWHELRPGLRHAELCRSAEFSVELVESSVEFQLDTQSHALVVIVLNGAGRMHTEHQDCTIARGETWLVPAACGSFHIESRSPLTLLLARAP